jgi:hypothetical protein
MLDEVGVGRHDGRWRWHRQKVVAYRQRMGVYRQKVAYGQKGADGQRVVADGQRGADGQKGVA